MAVSVRTEPTLRIDQPRTLFSRPVPARKLLVRVRHEPKDEGVSHGRCRRTDTAEACGGHGLSAGSRTVARIDGEIIARANEARSRRCAQKPASRSPRSRSTDAVRTRGACGAQARHIAQAYGLEQSGGTSARVRESPRFVGQTP